MKYYYLLGTLCTLITLMGISATAKADVSISVPAAEATGTDTPKSQTAPPTSQLALNSSELSIYNRVNEYRQSKNMPPLTIDPVISAQAKVHSERMAKIGRITHDGFNDRVESVAREIVYRSAAENVGYNVGYAQPEAIAVEDWVGSPRHQKNMVGRYDLTGIGSARNSKGEYYFTQIFIRKAYYVRDVD
jgi:uncharacterized protein YkwD